jgi:hypothetical protein
MLNFKNIFKPFTLLVAAVTFFLFLPDLDIFSTKFNTAPQLLGLLSSNFDDTRFQTIYGKLTCLLLVGISALCTLSCWLKNQRLKVLLIGSGVLVLYAWTLLTLQGAPSGTLVRTSSLIGIYLDGNGCNSYLRACQRFSRIGRHRLRTAGCRWCPVALCDLSPPTLWWDSDF